LSESIDITSNVAAQHRTALEELIFFNANQHRMRRGIQHSIETYGVPEICEHDGSLSIRVGDIRGVQTLFAVSETGRPLGVAVFVQLPSERIVVLHLVVDTRLRSSAEVNIPVLRKLMHEIRAAARHADGLYRIELMYKPRRTPKQRHTLKQRHAARLDL
jgi:hypothetical protein